MAAYIIRRLWQIIPTMAGVILLIFTLFNVVGGDPAYLLAGKISNPEQIANIRKQLGIDEPYWMQLLIFFGTLLFTKIQQDEKYRTYHNLYLFASLILIAFGNLETVGGRLSSPFATYEMFVAPYFILNFTKNKLLNLIFAIGFTVIIFLLIFILSGDYQYFIPYQTLLNG